MVGSYEYDVNDILDKKRFSTWQYVHIYGSPISKSLFSVENDFFKKMNENPEIGSLWKGKIFIKIEYDPESASPRTLVTKTKTELNKEAETFKLKNRIKWYLEVQLIEALFLPENKKYSVRVSWEDKTILNKEFVIIYITKGS